VRATERAKRYRKYTLRLRRRRGRPAITRDGVAVTLTANVELPAEAVLAADEARPASASIAPSTSTSRSAPADGGRADSDLRDVLRVMSPRTVVFRTFDLGADKLQEGAPGPAPRTPRSACAASVSRWRARISSAPAARDPPRGSRKARRA